MRVPASTGAPKIASTRGVMMDDLVWNLIGLLGLLGLIGMWRSSDNDGYTDDPI
jgi:hypothetical protein